MLDVLCVGHASFDVTMSVAHHPEPDEKMVADALQSGGGGPAANAAVQVARLGGTAAFCGYLGKDIFGEAHLAEFAAQGVDTACVVRGGHATPVSQILAKPDGSRSVVNCKGDTPWLPADALDARALARLSPRVVLLDGHEPLLSAPVCRWANSHGIPVVLDAGSVHCGTRELAGQVDYLVASERFARDFCREEQVGNCMRPLSLLAPNIVVTCGARGLLWQRQGEAGALTAWPVRVVDSTGAGDAFHGAFSLGLARGMEWSEILAFASAAGALACTRLGARAALPAEAEVRSLLETAGKVS
jgi:sulfofructose kinase